MAGTPCFPATSLKPRTTTDQPDHFSIMLADVLTQANEQAEADVVVADLVADLEATRLTVQPKQQEPAAEKQTQPTESSVAAVTAEHSLHLHTLKNQLQQHEAVELTPEQDAAAEECAAQFVDLYEHVSPWPYACAAAAHLSVAPSAAAPSLCMHGCTCCRRRGSAGQCSSCRRPANEACQRQQLQRSCAHEA